MAEEEAETRELIRQQAEREEQRQRDNLIFGGDLFGLDDGRPGMGINPTGWWFGNLITMSGGTYLLISLVVLAIAIVIIVVGQTLKRTSYGQQALQGSQPATAAPTAQSAAPVPQPTP